MLYFAIGIAILVLNDSTKCQNTGIGLISSGCAQYISCAIFLAILIIQKRNSKKDKEPTDDRDRELMHIITNPSANFSKNSVVRDKQGSLLSINTK